MSPTAPAPRLSDLHSRRQHVQPGLVLAFLLSLLLPVALPAAAGAATVRVEPYREEPDPSGAPGCAKYMTCPVDMVVFIAAPGEINDVTVIYAGDLPFTGAPARSRFLVSDHNLLQAGAGCQRVGMFEVVCEAATFGSVELGDSPDRITGSLGFVSGGPDDDVLDITGNGANGGEGDDVVIARTGDGGPGDDVLSVTSGDGGAGNDLLRCLPQGAFCGLRGGPGNDRLLGATGNQQNSLVGAEGHDFLDGRGGKDYLDGGSGNDRLRGGGGTDVLRSGSGNDRLEARELRSLGERTAKDDVNCGAGRRDRALTDRRDRVTRCERVTRKPRAH